DHILVLSEGRVVESGGYDELAERGVLSDHEFNESDNQSKGSGHQMSRQTSRVSESESAAQVLRQISMTRENEQKVTESEVKNSQLIDKETENFGSIKMSVYLDYLRRIPLIYTLIPLMSAFLFNACEVGANFWLNIWTTHNSTQVDNNFYLSVYLSAIVSEAMFVLIFFMVQRTGAVIAAGVLHKDMLSCILRTPLSFFDVTPSGRIINRFNRDVEQIDTRIPWCLSEVLFQAIKFLYIVALVIYMNAYMTVLILIIVIRIYLWTSRQLNRLNSITRSPIYSHFNESISGAVSIRVYKVHQLFTEKLHNYIDVNVNIQKHLSTTEIWLNIWTTIIGLLVSFSTSLYVVLERDNISPGFAGFVLIYSVNVIGNISWALRMVGTLETEMVCLERVREYSQLDPEYSWESTDANKPSDLWPRSASIEFIDYSASYRRGLEPVLKNLNFRVESGEKVGIVGRTGAGKSSMTLALFRIIEPTFGQ
ncbi:unnamed protein product, partial [Oppiella nova]